MSWLGSLIGAGASLLGGSMNRKSTEAANEKNAALQREFAQNGIQWKVEDAKKAGVHPIYALGASTMSAAPSYVGDTSMGSAIAEAGQDISRAVSSNSTLAGRTQTRMAQLALERGELENDLLRSQIARNVQTMSPPVPTAVDGFKMPGQADSGLIDVNPMPLVASDPSANFQEASSINELGFARTALGTFVPVMSKDFKDRSEDDLVAELGWHWRNSILPMFTPYSRKGQGYLPGIGYYKLPWKSHHGK